MMNYGLGFTFSGKDNVSNVANRVNRSISKLRVNSQGNLEAINNNFMKVGMGMAQITAGFAQLSGIKKATQAWSDFEKGVAEIHTLMDEGQMQRQTVAKDLMDISNLYGGDMTKNAKAYYDAISAGVSDLDAKGFLELGQRMAIGGVTDVSTAVDALTTVKNVYGLSLEEMGAVSDTFFIGVKQGKTTMNELGAEFGRVASTAKELNIGYDELMGSIATGTKLGVRTNEMVSGMNMLFQNIIKPTGKMTEAIKKAGLGMGKEGIEAAGGLTNYLLKLKSVSTGTDLEQMFSSRALTAALKITSEEGKTALQTLDAMKNKAGVMDEAYEKMANTSAHKTQMLKSSLHDLYIELGKVIEPLIDKVRKSVQFLVDKFRGLSDSQKKIILGITSFSGILSIISGASMVFSGTLGSMKASFMGLLSPLKMLPMLFSPWGIILVGIGTTIGVLIHKLGGFEATLNIVKDALKPAIAVLKMFYETIEKGGITDKTLKDIENTFGKYGMQSIMNFYTGVLDILYEVKKSFIDFGKGFVDGFSQNFNSILNNLITFGTKLYGFFNIVFSGITDIFNEMFGGKGVNSIKNFGQVLGQVFSSVFNFILNGFNLIMSVVNFISKTIVGTIKGLVIGLKDAFSKSKISESLKEIWESIGNIIDKFQAMGDYIGSSTAFQTLKTVAMSAIKAIGYGLGTMLSYLFKALAWVGKRIEAIFTYFEYGTILIIDFFSNFGDYMSDIGSLIGYSILNSLNFVWSGIKWLGKNIGEFFKFIFSNLADGLINSFAITINGFIDIINSAISALPDIVKDKLGISEIDTIDIKRRVGTDFEYKEFDYKELEGLTKARNNLQGRMGKALLDYEDKKREKATSKQIEVIEEQKSIIKQTDTKEENASWISVMYPKQKETNDKALLKEQSLQTKLLKGIFKELKGGKSLNVVLEGNLENLAEGVNVGQEEIKRRNFVEVL